MPPRRDDPALRLHLAIQLGRRVQLPADRGQLRRWVRASLHADATLLLRFVDRAEGRALNKAYRDRDYATNVLTFPYETPLEAAPTATSPPQVQADIVLCLPVVREEARRQHKSLRDHLAHLVVHGVLHAQGLDHEDNDAAQRMEDAERRILARFRIADPYRIVGSRDH